MLVTEEPGLPLEFPGLSDVFKRYVPLCKVYFNKSEETSVFSEAVHWKGEDGINIIWETQAVNTD